MLMCRAGPEDIFEFLTILRSLVTGPNGMVHMYKPFSLMENVRASSFRAESGMVAETIRGIFPELYVGLVRKTARTSWCLADFGFVYQEPGCK